VLEIDIFPLLFQKHSMNPDSIYRHIGELIKSRRKRLKPPLTQQELAQRLGISRASLANIETGRQNVLVHHLYDFARALGLSPNDFLLPADDTGTRGEWNDLMPDNLKPQQKEQIARLLADTPAEPNREKDELDGKKTKR
jgi:transcriptional regulator with XRE-family HTH domain